MKIVVCDTCSIIKLRKGGAIDCLGEIFDKVYLPTAVKEECVRVETQKALEKPFFEIHVVHQVLPLGMGNGEREAISLAIEQGIQTLITDDHKAFNKAVQQGLQPLRVFDLLVLAKRLQVIPSVKKILDTMKKQGEGIPDDLYFQTLKKSREI